MFAFEYSLACLLREWGIGAHAYVGHSVGEYVAACLAGVFTLEDAIEVVIARGRLVQALPAGAMLAIPVDEARASQLIGEELDRHRHHLEELVARLTPDDQIFVFESRPELAAAALVSRSRLSKPPGPR